MQTKNKNRRTSLSQRKDGAVRAGLLALALLVPAWAFGGKLPRRIKIGTIPDKYMPTNATILEPVSMRDFHFEVNQETRRARVVVDFTYPDELVFEKNDDKGGPQPTMAQLPGLRYDPKVQAVLYKADNRQTVCAHVEERKGIFGRRLIITNTGSCQVTAQDTKHAEDDGWGIRRFRAIDVYLEVY